MCLDITTAMLPTSRCGAASLDIELKELIKRDVDTVWSAIADVEALTAWQTNLRSVITLSGIRGETESVCELIYDENGREVRLRETIREARRPHLLTATYQGDQARTEVRNELIATDAGETRWTLHCRLHFRGLLPRLLGLFMKTSIRRRIEDDMRRLRDSLEAE